MSNFIGKYVCFGNSEGGFCFGRIVKEIEVNSPHGIKESFILEDRLTYQGQAQGVAHAKGRNPKEMTPADFIVKHRGQTTVRKDKLDLEKDIFEKEMGLSDLSDDELFLLLMKADPSEIKGISLGVLNMAKVGSPNLDEAVKDALNGKLG